MDYTMKRFSSLLFISLFLFSSISFAQNHAPGFYPQPERGNCVGDTLVFSLTAYDLDSDPLTWSASNLPAGAIFNNATQEFSWCPDHPDIGDHTVTFTVNDGQGHSVSKDVIIKVVNRGEWYIVRKHYPLDFEDVFFINDTLGWAVEECGVLYTTDGGIYWQYQYLGPVEHLISAYFTDANNGWIAGAEGVIFHTCDGGANWENQNSGTDGELLDVYFIDSNNGWVVGYKDGSEIILHTADGGTNWETQSIYNYPSLSGVCFIDSDTGWAVGASGIILKTTDSGATWNEQTSGTGETLRKIHFEDPNTGWICGNNGIILNTFDGGANWTSQSSSNNADMADIFFSDSNNGWAVGDTGTVVHTTDGGTTWMRQTIGIYHTISSVYFINSDTGWAVGPRNIIIYTIDGGANWNMQNSGGTTEDLMDVFFTDANNGWAVGDYNTFLHSTDGGKTWTELHVYTDNNVVDVFFFDSNNGWVVEEDSIILHTVDGGNTWTKLTAPSIDYLFRLHFIDPNNGWLVGSDGLILNTNDGGVNWTQQNSGWTDDLNDVYFANSTTGWVVGGGEYEQPVILHTSDGGTTWQQQQANTNNLLGLSFIDSLRGWAVGLYGVIVHTTDGGKTWINQESGVTTDLFQVHFIDSNIGWVSGWDETLLFTSTGGEKWEIISSGGSNGLSGIHFINHNTGWISSYSGLIFKYRAPEILLSHTDHIIDPGNTINIPLKIEGIVPGVDIVSFEYHIGFDTSKITVDGIQTSGLLAEGFTIETNFPYNDTLKIAGMRDNPLSGTGTFMNITVTAQPDAPCLDTTSMVFKNCILNEGFPAVIAAPGKIITSGPLYGDVSRDGTHSALDASLILQYRVDLITLSDTALTASDVTANGEVTAYDAAQILRYVAGLISTFPSGHMFAPKEANHNSIAFLEKESENELFVEYVLNLKNVQDIYAVEIALEFTGLEYKTCEKTEITKDYLLVENAKDGILKIALAGFKPINNVAKIIKLKFGKLLGEGNIKLNSVVVNETSINVINDLSKLLPETYELHQNYPNPFNAETIIEYQIPEAGKVEISIYNTLGQKVRTLVNSSITAGYHETKWNGMNDAGETVSSGIYFITLKAGNFIKTRKMIYLR